MPSVLSVLRQFLFDWQTLIAGVLAVVAAIGTIVRMSQQNDLQRKAMEAAERRFNEQGQRRSWAYRARMIDVFNDLSDYSEKCIRVLTKSRIDKPSLPSVEILNDSIEYLDPQSAEAVFDIVSKLQVQSARFRDFDYNENLQPWAQLVHDALELKALTDRMFPYVRRREEVAKVGVVSREELMRVWRLTGERASMTESQREAIHSVIESHPPAGNEN